MSDQQTPEPAPAEEAPASHASPAEAVQDAPAPTDSTPQYGVGPFSLREVVLVGVWLVAFVVSFFPVIGFSPRDVLSGGAPASSAGPSVWTGGLDWILTIGVPTVAVFLVVLRRLSPQGIRRVGSLGVDQFASVAFSVSTMVWLAMLWSNVGFGLASGLWLNTWVVWVEFFVMAAGVVLTVLAPIVPPFSQDFQGRPEATAHRSARPVRALAVRPPRPKPVVADAAPPVAEAAPVAAVG
ncbi:MAG: hypothetical protein QM611_02335, partial [Microbacterium sp.]